MTVEAGGLRNLQRTQEPVIIPIGRIICSWEQEQLYKIHWPILYNTIPPLLLLCWFYLLKALSYMESLGFFGENLGNLLSGLLLTTFRDRPQRTGLKV
jgi:hypothetical protein